MEMMEVDGLPYVHKTLASYKMKNGVSLILLSVMHCIQLLHTKRSIMAQSAYKL